MRLTPLSRPNRPLLAAILLAVSTLVVSADPPLQHTSEGPVMPLWDLYSGDQYEIRNYAARHSGMSPDGSRLYVIRRLAVLGLDAADGTELWSSEGVIPGGFREIEVSETDIVVVLNQSFGDIFVVGVDGTTGAQLWRQTVDVKGEFSSPSPISLALNSNTGRVAVVWYDTSFVGHVAALDLSTGTILWTRTMSALPGDRRGDLEFSLQGDRIFVLTPIRVEGWGAFDVTAFDAGSGVTQWSQQWVNGYTSGGVFVPYGHSQPYALEVSPDDFSVVAVGYTRAICEYTEPFFARTEGEVKIAAFAYDAASGATNWRYLPDAEGGDSTGDPCLEGSDAIVDLAISPAGQVIMAGQSLPPDPLTSTAWDAYTVAVDLATGARLWSHRAGRQGVGGQLRSTVRLTRDGATAVVASSRQLRPYPDCAFGTYPGVVGLSTADGTTIWSDLWAAGCEFGNQGVYQDVVLSPDGMTAFGTVFRDPTQAVTALGFEGATSPPSDTTPPVFEPVSNLTVEATGPDGAIVTYVTPGAADVEDGAVAVNCAPASGSLFSIGETTVTCTASDSAGNEAQTWFLVSVVLPIIEANLGVTLAPAVSQPQVLGAAVPYIAAIHNAGPDAAGASLTVELQYRAQTAWGEVPPAAAINGIFFMDVGPIGVGQTVAVPFEVIYEAFGKQTVTATVNGTGNFVELSPGDNAATYDQTIDLPFDASGVEIGGFSLSGDDTTDGEPLALIGVRVPGALIAGAPHGDLFVPSELTPGDLVQGGTFIPAVELLKGKRFRPGAQTISGDLAMPEPEAWISGSVFLAEQGDWLTGDILFPALDASNKALGRLLFARGVVPTRSDVLVTALADTSLEIGAAAASAVAQGGLRVLADAGEADAAVTLCNQTFGASLGHGDSAAFTCGSLTAEVISGEIIVNLDDGTLLEIPAGAAVKISERDGGGWDITALSGNGIVVIVGEHSFTLNDGETLDPNLPPVANAGGPYLGAVDTIIALDGGGSSDPNDDPLSYTWSAVEGSISDGTSATAGFSATSAGIYTIALQVCDPFDACETAISSVVVYDPAAGFVTGGGWIDSPPGSCGPAAPDEVCAGDLTGRATFGFVAKYKKGANTPEGQTAFAFEAANLRFHSDAYEWLVVSGENRAQFKGTGSINGVPGYDFMLTLYDGGDSAIPDGLRLKISTGDGVVYDNRAGMDDSLNHANVQTISGGSIVIHTK